jgi:hypothetical protein
MARPKIYRSRNEQSKNERHVRNYLAERLGVSKKGELDLEADDTNEDKGENELSKRGIQRSCWLT